MGGSIMSEENEVQEIDYMAKLEEEVKNSIIIETLRAVNSNMGYFENNMLNVCTMLKRDYQLEAGDIEKILDRINAGKVFKKMFESEYSSWIALGVKCQEYFQKSQAYIHDEVLKDKS
jgi:hypothetical protein